MTLSFLPFLLSALAGFNVEASASMQYTIDIPHEQLRSYDDDMGLLERHMPGVVDIRKVGHNRYMYRTRKSVPLGSDLKLDFLIARRAEGDATVYESIRPEDPNYMRCVVRLAPAGPSRTSIEISLVLRLRRESGGDVHWMAPIVGEQFISDRMSDDIREMLDAYREKSSIELLARFQGRRVGP